ncbi:hypothetical protein Bcav_2517 [Beutenbergia cavernae DSM 12333]|uniref:Uncharacterized protein n=1 Tax=Beutenbergia cavernae (strain ATCC BAA-8 / DSM 12333 / CCUG 43141 / JCM 11478 / NBRC 16432 / NCIMB 13614 / HKI 0122) TaxID=471853 RepID=C5BWV0_BEUC1|nr:hypothetical protein [Beutenbergia cavernae]ACQ80766.1 hypothetical protein Bcav_2517 [Beutenbergia cavernae DSM 12333]
MSTLTPAPTTPYALASLADVAIPDAVDSPGARWLVGVADAAAEDAYRLDHGEHAGDVAHEVADAAVPVYTADLWAVYVDLAAYREDVAELLEPTTDPERLARVALYAVAARLAALLLAGAEV